MNSEIPTKPIQPIERSYSLAEIAYERIKGAIVDTTLEPGQVLRESRLADSLQISRTPVREALIRLQQDGWIESADGRGFTVVSLAKSDIDDVFELRLLLETRASRYFAELADRALIDELVGLIEEIAPEIGAGDYSRHYAVHERLHRVIIEDCPNKLLRQMLLDLEAQTARIRVFARYDRDRHVREAYVETKELLAALASRDARQVELRMAAHLAAARERVLAQLQESQVRTV